MFDLTLLQSALAALFPANEISLSPASSGDIAEWNLICAQALPGSQTLDIDGALARLDGMAHHVDCEIRRNYHRFVNLTVMSSQILFHPESVCGFQNTGHNQVERG